MKYFRTYLTGLAVAGLVVATTGTSRAAFSSKGTKTVSATASIGGTPTIAINSLAVKNIADNSTASGLGWSGLTSGYSANGGWKLSDQYIAMNATVNTTKGGIQIYTDNTDPSANPKFTGPNDGVGANPTPAGLVNINDTTQKLPTAWMASTQTISSADPRLAPVDPNAANGFNWFFHEDLKQHANTNLNAGPFVPAAPYVTVYAAPGTTLSDNATDTEVIPTTGGGVHYAAGLDPVTHAPQFGPFVNGTSVTNIYTEANFSSALAGATYGTNRIILEAFSL